MNTRNLATALVLSLFVSSAQAKFLMFGHYYGYEQFEASLRARAFAQAAERLRQCAANSRIPDQRRCIEKIDNLPKGMSVEEALRLEDSNGHEHELMEIERKKNDRALKERIERVSELRASSNPWDKYLLFTELSAGKVEQLDAEEPARIASEAFSGFGDCAKAADPSCMSMYGELIIHGMETLPEKEKPEARRKAIYWLSLAARYGNEPARKVLIAEGENVPTPDLAMEQLQKEANTIAKNTAASQERMGKEQAARDYELIRQQRRQTEQLMWANLFPRLVTCTSTTFGTATSYGRNTSIGTNTYTSCR